MTEFSGCLRAETSTLRIASWPSNLFCMAHVMGACLCTWFENLKEVPIKFGFLLLKIRSGICFPFNVLSISAQTRIQIKHWNHLGTQAYYFVLNCQRFVGTNQCLRPQVQVTSSSCGLWQDLASGVIAVSSCQLKGFLGSSGCILPFFLE